MKICFFLQRRFVYIGHEMVRLLQERYGISQFCGYVSLRKGFEFLKSQNDVTYSDLILEEDIYGGYKKEELDYGYLIRLEKEIGLPNLWFYVELDRIIRNNLLLREYPYDKPKYSDEEMLKVVQAAAKAISDFLDREKPDCVFFSVISNIGSLLLYHLAKKRGIRTIVMYIARTGNKHYLSEFYDDFDQAHSHFREIRASDGELAKSREEARVFLRRFQDNPKYYKEDSGSHLPSPDHLSRFHHLGFLKPLRFWRSLFWIFRSIREYWRYKDDYSTIKPWHAFIDKILRKWRRLRGYEDLYEVPVKGENYIYFSLHVEPEACLALSAPFYKDQVWLVKQAARSLPVGYRLYVKDHPAMVGYRPRSYYKELKAIPNVRLINAAVSSFDLIRGSKLVMGVLGTVGWEALMLKKPVIIFGHIFYDCLSGVKKCRAIEDLPYLVSEQLTKFKYNEDEIVDFIAALFRESVDLDLIRLWEAEGGGRAHERREELIPLVDLLANKLGLRMI